MILQNNSNHSSISDPENHRSLVQTSHRSDYRTRFNENKRSSQEDREDVQGDTVHTEQRRHVHAEERTESNQYSNVQFIPGKDLQNGRGR